MKMFRGQKKFLAGLGFALLFSTYLWQTSFYQSLEPYITESPPEAVTDFIGDIEMTFVDSISEGWSMTLAFNMPTMIYKCLPCDVDSITEYRMNHTIVNKSWNKFIPAGGILKIKFAARTQYLSPLLATVSFRENGNPDRKKTINSPEVSPTLIPAVLVEKYEKDNYSMVLHKSILFYEAQRSGWLPKNNRINWRGDSAVHDGGDIDLTGGWYDAGDYMKFTFPMAWSVTVISWGILEFQSAYLEAEEYENALDCIKWPLDYFLKCHNSSNELYVQVGNAFVDHAYFGRPENMNMERPSYKVDKNRPGSDVSAETAAAMAAGYLVFKDYAPVYANTLLQHAEELFEFAEQYRGIYSDLMYYGGPFYTSSGYEDELLWAAAWLYRATKKQRYMNYIDKNIKLVNGLFGPFSWDNKEAGIVLLMYELTGKEKYKQMVQSYLESWSDNGSIHYTPTGLAWKTGWGTNRYTANTAALALIASKAGIEVNMGSRSNRPWAIRQVDLLMGGGGQSLVVGFGPKYPKRPHHRASACPLDFGKPCTWKTFSSSDVNPNILRGALVGGIDMDGTYWDDRKNFSMSEVAVDYNAGWQTAVAGVKYFKMKAKKERNDR